MEPRRRALLWAVAIAVAVGFALGWYARVFWAPSPETRARDAFERMRERARDVTR